MLPKLSRIVKRDLDTQFLFTRDKTEGVLSKVIVQATPEENEFYNKSRRQGQLIIGSRLKSKG